MDGNNMTNSNGVPILKTKDIYKELGLRGYNYGTNFQCLTQVCVEDNRVEAMVKWNNNWITFTDSLFQSVIFKRNSKRGHIEIPIRIESFRCDPRVLNEEIRSVVNSGELKFTFDSILDIGVSKGLEFRGLKLSFVSAKSIEKKVITESYKFIPNHEFNAINREEFKKLQSYVRMCDELALNVEKKFKNREENNEENEEKPEILNNINAENKNLLKALKDMLECDSKKLSVDSLRSKLISLDNDLINQTLICESLLRPHLEIICENLFSQTMVILEVNASQTIISNNIRSLMDIIGFNKPIFYTLIHPNLIEILSKEDRNNIQIHDWISDGIPTQLNNFDLVVYKDISCSIISNKEDLKLKDLFSSLKTAIKTNGFLIVLCKNKITFGERVICDTLGLKCYNSRNEEIIREAENKGFVLISSKSDSISSMTLLFRKYSNDVNYNTQPYIHISNDHKLWIEKLKELLLIQLRPKNENIWLIANDVTINGILGFVKCLVKESNDHRLRCIFNNSDIKLNALEDIDFNSEPLKSIVKMDLTFNVIKDLTFGTFRHQTININEQKECEHCCLHMQTRGNLSSFKWFESQHKYWPIGRNDNQTLCRVYYSALNFKDIMFASGKLSFEGYNNEVIYKDYILGMEFSGRDETGNRVMGIVSSQALATTVVIEDHDFLWSIPQQWSMEDASTIPVVYTTAYYALIIRGKLKRGETVLIHSGSGGVGQAAIAICLSMDCKVYTTVGSQEKRQFLMKEFPQLCDQNFSNSRTTEFEKYIMEQTIGRGVDVILNSLSEDKLQASLRCLSEYGRFLEIGKFDMLKNSDMDMTSLKKNKTFESIFADQLFGNKRDYYSPLIRRQRNEIKELIFEGIRRGTVRPLRKTVFDANECEEAFRFMASGKHIGKVVIKIRDEQQYNNNFIEHTKLLAIPRTVFYPNKSYIITGGLGGFGLELANWMTERGANNLVLTSRRGPKESYQQFMIRKISDKGVNVLISTEDASTLNGANEILNQALSLSPIGGLFHLSIALKDDLFENQSNDKFREVFASKSDAFINFDKLSREMCIEMDYFVAFSSIASGRGNAGQSNYGFANSIMERVCEVRRNDGLHGLAIQWGPIAGTGLVFDNEIITVIANANPQRMDTCLETLDGILQSEYAVCSSHVNSDIKHESFDKNVNLTERVAHILGLKSGINLSESLGDLGLDSIMAVEIKQLLEIDYGISLAIPMIRRLKLNELNEINNIKTT